MLHLVNTWCAPFSSGLLASSLAFLLLGGFPFQFDRIGPEIPNSHFIPYAPGASPYLSPKMGRKLSVCFILVRLFQLLGAFIPAAMNGWLLAYIYSNNLGPSKIMLVLEVLVATVFIYTASTMIIIHTRQRSRKKAWLVCSICFDLLLCFVNVAIVSLLSFTGVPSNCSGLTTTSVWSKADKPSRGYTTILFSNEQDGHRGELDRFCGMERGFFFCAVLVILAYIITIMMSLCRIFDLHYTRNSEIQHLLDEREEILKLELKIQEQEAAASRQPAPAPTSGPQNSATRPSDEEASILASMARPTGQPAPSSRFISGARSPALPLTAIPGVGSSSSAAAAERLSPMDFTAVEANLAMITDGSRHGLGQQQPDHNQLPPYTPGNQRTMNGHGSESNDMLLSGYVKGETRAQDMKDAGGF